MASNSFCDWLHGYLLAHSIAGEERDQRRTFELLANLPFSFEAEPAFLNYIR